MIAASIELQPAIDRLNELDSDFKCFPSEQGWENGKKVFDCLKIFSDITKKHPGVKYPTANLYFIDVCSHKITQVYVVTSNIEYNSSSFPQRLVFSRICTYAPMYG